MQCLASAMYTGALKTFSLYFLDAYGIYIFVYVCVNVGGWVQAIENVLGSAQYNANKVTQWTNFIVEDVLKNLQFQGKPFKYIGKRNGIWHQDIWVGVDVYIRINQRTRERR